MRITTPEKTWTSLEEYQRDWIAAFKRAGHSPVLAGGRVDHFAYNPNDPHNGPRCKKCGEGWCWHCTSPAEVVKEKCGGIAHKRKVEREADDAILKQAAEIRAKRRSQKRSAA